MYLYCLLRFLRVLILNQNMNGLGVKLFFLFTAYRQDEC